MTDIICAWMVATKWSCWLETPFLNSSPSHLCSYVYRHRHNQKMDETSAPPASAACSTCQTLLHKIPSSITPELNEKQSPFNEKNPEKPISLVHYKSECCGRYVCFLCISVRIPFLYLNPHHSSSKYLLT